MFRFDLHSALHTVHIVVICSCFFPCSLGGAWAFGLVRVLQGVCEGVTFPSLHALTARWVPPEERASFVARSY